MGDFGAGIKFYPKGGFFIRPEARFYLVNNNVDYSSSHVTRFGASIGYTFRVRWQSDSHDPVGDSRRGCPDA